jgi:hypothetical protein
MSADDNLVAEAPGAKSSPVSRRQRSVKRIIGWSVFYLLLLVLFVAVIFIQGRKVNTLGFASGQIILSTNKVKYTIGQDISYTIKNNLSQPIVFLNKCPNEPLHIYQLENSQWVRIHNIASSTACINQPTRFIINPNQQLTRSLKPWLSLFSKPGIYRIVAFASNYTALPYTDFQVAGKAIVVSPKIIYKPVYTPIYIKSDGGGGSSTGGDN